MATEYADHALTTKGWSSRGQGRVQYAKKPYITMKCSEAICFEIRNVGLAVAGNNPMVGMTVAVAVAVSQALAK